MKETQKQVNQYVAIVRQVDSTLDPASDKWTVRKRTFGELERELFAATDPICQHLGRVMASFKSGLFAGGGRVDFPRDNLDLERWFRLPKGHERRIHGRCHAGVRIVQEGATMMLALDAHRHHPKPFTQNELCLYRHASIPDCQNEAIRRRKLMRTARSTKTRASLLRNLEKRYANSSHR